jgi:hypothetical protein
MAALTWDQTTKREYETGVEKGVLYIPDNTGAYNTGFAWNGLVSVTEAPSGAESNKQYADNRVYANLLSAEEFGGTIEAFMYPKEFGECDGTASPKKGLYLGQQTRKPFGLSYKTLLGNDVENNDFGYKLHLVYGALASPSEKAYTTVNDSPELITFSWEFTTTPVAVPGLKAAAILTINSTQVAPLDLAALEALLYGTTGTPGTQPELPLPADVFALFTDIV